MEPNISHFLNRYLENLQVQLFVCSYTKVGPDWFLADSPENFNRLYYIVEGEGRIKIDDDEYAPSPGQLFLLPAGTRHSFSTISDNTFTKFYCHFTATVGDIPLSQILKLPHYIEVSKKRTVTSLFTKMIKLYNEGGLSAPTRIKAILFELLSEFIDRAESDPSRVGTMPSFHKINIVLEYIDRHLTEPITVDTLAKLVHFHPNYFMPYFKSILGVSPIAYVNKKRVEQVQYLLHQTEMSISEISKLMNMDIYYMSKLFKQYTGFPPSKFRRLRHDPPLD